MKKFYLFFAFFLASLTTSIHAQITCDFNFLNTGVRCTPYVIIADSVSNLSPYPIIERRWYLTGTHNFTVVNGGPNPRFTYAVTDCGNYCLEMWAMNSNGDTCSITKCFDVGCPPTVSAVFSPTQGCAPLNVSAVLNCNPGSGTITAFNIDWGCGPSSGFPSCPSTPVSHIYTCIPGQYSPSIFVQNSFGCSTNDANYQNLIEIIPPLVACFTRDTSAAFCNSAPLPVNFTACNAGPNITYCWYINGVLMQCGPSRFFSNIFPINNLDCYDVKLVVQHPSGCADSLVAADNICNFSSPQVCFTVNEDTACAPFTLVANNCTPGIANLNWTVSGPGGSYPIVVGPADTLPLTMCGTYTITGTAIFAPGCTATLTRQVVVLCPPVASFTANDTFSCKLPMPVIFTAVPCAGCMYSWGFGNGASPNSNNSTNSVVTANYVSTGTWPSSLRVTSPNGCVSTAIRFNYIEVREINPVIGQDRAAGCSPVCVNFTDLTNYGLIPDSINTVCWSFPGSGLPGACQSSVNRCFTNPGCYDVKLVVTTTTGCADSLILNDTVCVGTPLNCTVTASPTTLCFEQEPVVFSVNCGLDSFDYAFVRWGDGDSGIVTRNPFEHQYQDIGNMNTEFTFYKDSCPGNIITVPILVNGPIAKFATVSSCNAGDTVYFNNQSRTATSYLWEFLCNGTASTLDSPKVLLPPCDTCTVRLTAYNSTTGCSHVSTRLINTACGLAAVSPANANICASRLWSSAAATFCNTSQSSISTYWDNYVSNGIHFGAPGNNCVTYFYPAPGQYTIAMQNVSPGGCVDTAYATLKICKPIADFTYSQRCLSDTVCFIDSTVDQLCNITFRRWSFGDGTVDTVSTNPCHRYAAPGNYTVKLFVRNDMGCRDSITKVVSVGIIANPNYEIDTFFCPASQQCVINFAPTLPLFYQWEIPNALPYDTFGIAPCFTITAQGDYWVYANITSGGCTVRDSTLVHVCSPVASGTVSNNYFACPDLTNPVVFMSTSQCADRLTWDFGDQIYSNADTTYHFYAYPGCYPVTLIACNGTCCDTSIIDTICIGGPHIADYSASPSLMCACDDTVHFSFGTIEASSVILLYGCNQGNVQVNPITPIGTPQNPTYFDFYWPFCLTDSCQPQMIVGDSNGCITFLRFPAIYIDSADADFTANTFGVCGSGVVCFDDNTRYVFPQNHSVQWLWSFGDGATDTIQNPCHYYSTEGTYTISLRVVSNVGCVDSVSKQLTIHGYPTAHFGFVVNDSCNSSVVCYHDSSSADAGGIISHWQWCFVNGIICDTSGANVCHTYASEGNYITILTVADENGCTDSYTSPVAINFTNTAHASFIHIINNGLVEFINTSTGNVSSVAWDFGDFITSSLSNPVHQYNLGGSYTVTLTVTDANGCTDDTAVVISFFITSVNKLAAEVDVKIVPNPFNDFTNIQITGAEGEYSFSVFNLIGNEIKNVKLKSSEVFKLYRDKLASGLYLFEVRANNKLLKRGKIVLQ